MLREIAHKQVKEWVTATAFYVASYSKFNFL